MPCANARCVSPFYRVLLLRYSVGTRHDDDGYKCETLNVFERTGRVNFLLMMMMRHERTDCRCRSLLLLLQGCYIKEPVVAVVVVPSWWWRWRPMLL